MKKDYRILVVDDEQDIVELLRYNLQREGYQVKTAFNGKEAVDIVQDFQPHLILLDIMMPLLDGIEACRQIRNLELNTAPQIIFLTARSEEYSEVAAFDAGADDFINKPIKMRALLSRVSAYCKRSKTGGKLGTKIEIGDLVIDRESYLITLKNEKILLPRKEFELLSFLASSPNRVFTREELLQHIWGADVYVLARTIDVHIRKIREKVGEEYITTIKGIGYKFDYPGSD
jgi:two-component system alkaline phosphatase synthesis response regulator PhoP